eukprot:comp21963_c1_seq1/m.50193 comp21963_c1_seq1/g.50193  ORF comp21963_c1_seq1/g.50193 comp21963_c1_seq1/m.50193 type:complete len:859 (-) comp21963_c1_seq1:207-2783(-)
MHVAPLFGFLELAQRIVVHLGLARETAHTDTFHLHDIPCLVLDAVAHELNARVFLFDLRLDLGHFDLAQRHKRIAGLNVDHKVVAMQPLELRDSLVLAQNLAELVAQRSQRVKHALARQRSLCIQRVHGLHCKTVKERAFLGVVRVLDRLGGTIHIRKRCPHRLFAPLLLLLLGGSQVPDEEGAVCARRDDELGVVGKGEARDAARGNVVAADHFCLFKRLHAADPDHAVACSRGKEAPVVRETDVSAGLFVALELEIGRIDGVGVDEIGIPGLFEHRVLLDALVCTEHVKVMVALVVGPVLGEHNAVRRMLHAHDRLACLVRIEPVALRSGSGRRCRRAVARCCTAAGVAAAAAAGLVLAARCGAAAALLGVLWDVVAVASAVLEGDEDLGLVAGIPADCIDIGANVEIAEHVKALCAVAPCEEMDLCVAARDRKHGRVAVECELLRRGRGTETEAAQQDRIGVLAALGRFEEEHTHDPGLCAEGDEVAARIDGDAREPRCESGGEHRVFAAEIPDFHASAGIAGCGKRIVWEAGDARDACRVELAQARCADWVAVDVVCAARVCGDAGQDIYNFDFARGQGDRKARIEPRVDDGIGDLGAELVHPAERVIGEREPAHQARDKHNNHMVARCDERGNSTLRRGLVDGCFSVRRSWVGLLGDENGLFGETLARCGVKLQQLAGDGADIDASLGVPGVDAHFELLVLLRDHSGDLCDGDGVKVLVDAPKGKLSFARGAQCESVARVKGDGVSKTVSAEVRCGHLDDCFPRVCLKHRQCVLWHVSKHRNARAGPREGNCGGWQRRARWEARHWLECKQRRVEPQQHNLRLQGVFGVCNQMPFAMHCHTAHSHISPMHNLS